jgi:hypothetical protein
LPSTLVRRVEYVTSRGFALPETADGMENGTWFNLWSRRVWPYEELADGDVLYWYESGSGKLLWKSRVDRTERFQFGSKLEAAARLEANGWSVDREQPYFANASDHGYCLAYRVSSLERLDRPKPSNFRFPQSGWLRANDWLANNWLAGNELEDEAIPDDSTTDVALVEQTSRSREGALAGEGKAWELRPGDVIRRTELQDRYGGGRQGGIAPSRTTPNVLIFTDPKAGTQHGYIYDGWDQLDPTLFRCTGEGQHGDQRMVAGNRTILEHVEQCRALRVFKGVGDLVQYRGEFKLDPHPYETRRAPASGGGADRDVIVFRLRPITAATQPTTRRQQDAVYRRATPNPTQVSEEPFSRDPNLIDRALKAHADVQNGLNDFLKARRTAPWSCRPGEPDFDLAWIRNGTTFVAEVKSLTDTNEDRQLRLGLGQVLDYQELMAERQPGVRAVLAVEHQPSDPRWIRLCERHRVILVWPGMFDMLVDPTLT